MWFRTCFYAYKCLCLLVSLEFEHSFHMDLSSSLFESLNTFFLFGCLIFFLYGSFRGILGFLITSTALCLFIINKGLTYLGLILMASLVGLIMLLMLLEHSSVNLGMNDDNQFLDTFIISSLLIMGFKSNGMQVMETPDILRLTLIFESGLAFLLLCLFVYFATLCCVHIAIKPNQFNVKGLIDL